MATIIIDAQDAIAGRLGAFAAKQSLLGHTIRVINAQRAVITGKQRMVVEEAKREKRMGVARKGPYHSKLPDRFLRRIIRGMIPYKTPRGKAAYARVLCYIGTPPEFSTGAIQAPGASAADIAPLRKVTIGRICEEFGGRHHE